MSFDIARTTEEFLCARLTPLVANHRFRPLTGLGLNADETSLEPPFTVITITDPEKMMQQEGTWQCEGTAQVITHQDEVDSEAHATLVRQVYAALGNLQPVVDALFVFHGIDISTIAESTDDKSKCHAAIIKFTCGVSG